MVKRTLVPDVTVPRSQLVRARDDTRKAIEQAEAATRAAQEAWNMAVLVLDRLNDLLRL